MPVAISPGGPADHEIAATMCSPRRADTVQILLHGATYNRGSWDLPHRPNLYSYVRWAERFGFATLNIDRLGYGDSSHPPSTEVTWENSAFVVHQLVTKLRSGELGDYESVVTIGHSIGAAVAFQEAAEYQDVDAVVATGIAHSPGPGVPRLGELLYPAVNDPKFSDSGLDGGYLTTMPSTRDIFYSNRTTDPQVIEVDEELKDTIPVIEAEQIEEWWAVPPESNMTGQITAPVLFAIGQEDALYCDPGGGLDCRSTRAVRELEEPFFSNAARFDVVTLPATGHNLHLHRRAPAWFARVNLWLWTI